MTKRAKTLLFLAAAVLFNIAVTVLSFAALSLLYFAAARPFISDNFIIFGFPVIFITAIFLSFAVYRAVLRRFMRTFDMNRHFDTAFSFRKPTRNQQ